MLPTHGATTSALLLVAALHHPGTKTVDEWIGRASGGSSFLSSAINHRPVADKLLELALVLEAEELILSPKLSRIGQRADKGNLMQLAAIMVEMDPPDWLFVAVEGRRVIRELIPHRDLQKLFWLEPHLDQLLLGVRRRIGADADRSRELGIGRAAELVALEALRSDNRLPTLVADSADFLGYDIDCEQGDISYWEVKGCTSRTRGAFHLSRNEYDVASRSKTSWKLLQVEFKSSILMSKMITESDVAGIWLLEAKTIKSLAPAEEPAFRWEGSAYFHASADLWNRWEIEGCLQFNLPALSSLASDAAHIHESQSRQNTLV